MSWIWLGALALAAATGTGYAGGHHWLLELAAHFRGHLVALSFVWMILALFRHRPLAVALCAAVMAANAMPAVPYLIGGARTSAAPHSGPPVQDETLDGDRDQDQTQTAEGVALRLMTFNLHGRGADRRALLDFIQAEQPDVILLTELPPDDGRLLDSLGADYPHRVDSEIARPFEVVLLSRWPVAGWRFDRGADRSLPVLAADLCATPDVPATCLRLIGLHAARPFGPAVAKQTAQFAIAAEMARQASAGRAVVLGDLNITPWAARFAALLKAGNLRDAALGRGITATWLSRQPILGLAIDHILVSPDLVVAGFRVGPDLGSDHLPVLAELRFGRVTDNADR